MNVLVLGTKESFGGREHAILAALQEEAKGKLFAGPGNAGTADIATNLELDPLDNQAVLSAVREHKIGLVVPSNEATIENGATDFLNNAETGVLVFAPTQAAAQLETSKSFAIEVMRTARVPHPESWFFDNPLAVLTFAILHGTPLVVKADGLAGGKGVWICPTPKTVLHAAQAAWALYPGRPIVVQEFVAGQEVSVFGWTDGWEVSELVAACDYKPLYGGGPMTGGMGAYAQPPFWTSADAAYVRQNIMLPIIREMQRRGTPYRGVLYGGLMILPNGEVKVLEFNCRLGDPEAQVILPLFKGNILEAMVACARGHLPRTLLSWSTKAFRCGVVIASEGYPGAVKAGRLIQGIDEAEKLGCKIFHGGTKRTDNGIVTAVKPGRVLTVVGRGPTLADARKHAYAGCAKIRFKGSQMRHDIGRIAEMK